MRSFGLIVGQFFERPQILVLRRLVAVDLEQTRSSCGPRLPRRVSPLIHCPSRSWKRRHDFRRDENVLRCLDEIAFRVAQKTKAFAGNLDDAFAVFWFARRLVAVRQTALGAVGFLGRSVFARLAGGEARFRGVRAPALAFLRSIFLEDIRRAPVARGCPLSDSLKAPGPRSALLRRPERRRDGRRLRNGALGAWVGLFSVSSLIIATPLVEATRRAVPARSYQAGNLASNSSGISKLE